MMTLGWKCHTQAVKNTSYANERKIKVNLQTKVGIRLWRNCTLMWHFQPQVHHIWMSHSLPWIICVLSLECRVMLSVCRCIPAAERRDNWAGSGWHVPHDVQADEGVCRPAGTTQRHRATSQQDREVSTAPAAAECHLQPGHPRTTLATGQLCTPKKHAFANQTECVTTQKN